MKQFFFIFTLFIINIFGCKEKDVVIPTTPEIKLGVASGLTINGNDLPRTGMELIIERHTYNLCDKKYFYLYLTHRTVKTLYFQEFFDFTNIPFDSFGKMNLLPKKTIRDSCNVTVTSDFFTIIGKDVMGASYDLLDNIDNYLVIDRFDRTQNQVTGSIEATYIINKRSHISHTIYPDTIHFSNIKFTVPVNN